MKVGLIRCMQTENLCPASHCLDVMRQKKDAFADVDEEIILVGVSTCGGCPGKNAAQRAKHMVGRGADAIAMASCITLGAPLNFPCPFHNRMRQIIANAVGPNVKIIDYTHVAAKPGATSARPDEQAMPSDDAGKTKAQ